MIEVARLARALRANFDLGHNHGDLADDQECHDCRVDAAAVRDSYIAEPVTVRPVIDVDAMVAALRTVYPSLERSDGELRWDVLHLFGQYDLLTGSGLVEIAK